MRERPHTHPCSRCLVETECSGDLERNFDGWPEVVCPDYDMRDHGDFLCEDCRDLLPVMDEPGDIDGEDIFRDYPAELREAADAARRLK